MPSEREPDPAEIARRLTKAQRKLVQYGAGFITVSLEEAKALEPPLWKPRGFMGQGRHGYSLTDLGLAVRRAIAAEDA